MTTFPSNNYTFADRHTRRSNTTTFVTGAKSSISTSALQLTTTTNMTYYCVIVKADAANAGKVFVGLGSGVTNGSADATDGLQLSAGESVRIDIDDPSKIYVIGSAATQKVFWMAI